MDAREQRAIDRIEDERDASRLRSESPSLSAYERDLRAAHAWAFDVALQILNDELGTV